MQQHIFASEEMSFSDVSLYIPDSLRNCCQAQIKDSLLPRWIQFCQRWLCHDCNGMSLYSDHPCNKATHNCQGVMGSYVHCAGLAESRRGDTALTIPTSPAGWPELLVMEVIMQNLGMPGKLIQCKTQNNYLTCVQCTHLKTLINFLVSMASLKELKTKS